MWKINGANELINKAVVWKSKSKWKFRNVTKTKVYVENISNKSVLGVDEKTAEEEILLENNSGQIWDIGTPSKDGYFTLTNTLTNKLLTASSAFKLELKGDIKGGFCASRGLSALLFVCYDMLLMCM